MTNPDINLPKQKIVEIIKSKALELATLYGNKIRIEIGVNLKLKSVKVNITEFEN